MSGESPACVLAGKRILRFRKEPKGGFSAANAVGFEVALKRKQPLVARSQ